MSAKNEHYVFVYGTLRRGHHNHDLIRNSRFVGTYNTGPGYTKLIRGLPFLLEDYDGPGTEGEVYAVTNLTMALLDRLEGHPHWYQRKRIPVQNNVDNLIAWCYLMPKERI